MVTNLPCESLKNEVGNPPPFSGLSAMVQPVGVVKVQVAGDVTAGTVVFTMNAPSSRMGLKITCSLLTVVVLDAVVEVEVSGRDSVQPYWGVDAQEDLSCQQTGVFVTARKPVAG